MDLADALKGTIGGVVGFVLGQIVNVAKLSYGWLLRPRLVIETDSNYVILAHSTQLESGEHVQERIYGFELRNVGRSIATGIHVQLLKVEIRNRESTEYKSITENLLISLPTKVQSQQS